jgi:hypothetical protein
LSSEYPRTSRFLGPHEAEELALMPAGDGAGRRLRRMEQTQGTCDKTDRFMLEILERRLWHGPMRRRHSECDCAAIF